MAATLVLEKLLYRTKSSRQATTHMRRRASSKYRYGVQYFAMSWVEATKHNRNNRMEYALPMKLRYKKCVTQLRAKLC